VARCVLVTLTSCLFIAISLPADDAHDLLGAVSEKYDSLNNYLFEGSEAADLPGTGCILEMPFQIARTGPLPSSASTPASALPPTISFTARKPSKLCFDAVKNLGGFRSPGEWAEFDRVDVGVSAARILSQQILNLNGEEIHCAVLEVIYDDYYQKLKLFTGPIQYWIDKATHLVRRVEFTEITKQGPRSWTATIEKVSIGGPAPSWLGPAAIPYAQPALIGKPAPEFALRTSGGQVVHLSDLRGRAVLLDFWATWCLACDEEIPTLERLQTQTNASEVIVLGISDESGSVVREWLEQNHRSFRTLVDAKKTFQSFGIEPIPVLVVIDRQGVVTNYIAGFGSERRLRDSIRNLLIN
jgi:peroxiredoxin